MNNPNASSLFHFTDSFDVLKAIVSDGLMFSYSYEEHDFSSLREDEHLPFKGIAIPMICFCNTPISRVENHARVYGKFFISIDKEFLMEIYGPILNAVLYYSSNNVARSISYIHKVTQYLIDNLIRSASSLDDNRKERLSFMMRNYSLENRLNILPLSVRESMVAENNLKFASDFILGLSKPIFGKNKLGEDVYLDEEREWRAFWMDGCIENLKWGYYSNKEGFDADKENLKKSILNSKDSHLTLPSIEWANMITSIGVEKEAQIPELIDHILSSKTFFGCGDNHEIPNIKQYIISRITSFERLSQDI